MTDATAPWHHDAVGAGPPLALLHGIGMSRFAWSPVIPRLAERRRVFAFDLPGFGATPPLPAGVEPTPAALAAGLVNSLRALGVAGPVELAGNSLGGLVALEAAKGEAAERDDAATDLRVSRVTALSPGGLWGDRRAPAAAKFLTALRASARLPGARAAVRVPAVREAAFLLPVGPGCAAMPAGDAARILRDFAASTAFAGTLAAVRPLAGGNRIACPVVVAFGAGDRLLGPKCRRRDLLPPHAAWVEPPRWGHVPMWRDPAGVAGLILGDGPGGRGRPRAAPAGAHSIVISSR